jgi:outer membrane protein assembly factor BamD
MRWFALWVSLAALAQAAPTVDEPAEWFRTAQKLVTQGEQGRAIERYKAIVRHHPKSPWAGRAQLEIAQLYARNREFYEAFAAAQKVVEHYPDSELYAAAIEIQFGVAERVAEEYRRRRLKNDKSERDLPPRETASQMLRIILAHARYTQHAPRAQYRLAVSLDEEKQPAEAAQEFARFVEHYGEHDLADDAAFQAAFIDYRLSRDKNRERAAAERARLAFEEFLIRYPQSEKVPEARHLAGVLRRWESERLLVAARYYEKTNQPGPALRTYRGALHNDPELPEAAELREKIKSLESLVGSDPAPHNPPTILAQ